MLESIEEKCDKQRAVLKMAMCKMNKYDLRAALECFEQQVSEEEKGKESNLLKDARAQIDFITFRDRMNSLYQESDSPN